MCFVARHAVDNVPLLSCFHCMSTVCDDARNGPNGRRFAGQQIAAQHFSFISIELEPESFLCHRLVIFSGNSFVASGCWRVTCSDLSSDNPRVWRRDSADSGADKACHSRYSMTECRMPRYHSIDGPAEVQAARRYINMNMISRWCLFTRVFTQNKTIRFRLSERIYGMKSYSLVSSFVLFTVCSMCACRES